MSVFKFLFGLVLGAFGGIVAATIINTIISIFSPIIMLDSLKSGNLTQSIAIIFIVLGAIIGLAAAISEDDRIRKEQAEVNEKANAALAEIETRRRNIAAVNLNLPIREIETPGCKLGRCPTCKSQISTTAESCPHCGERHFEVYGYLGKDGKTGTTERRNAKVFDVICSICGGSGVYVTDSDVFGRKSEKCFNKCNNGIKKAVMRCSTDLRSGRTYFHDGNFENVE